MSKIELDIWQDPKMKVYVEISKAFIFVDVGNSVM
jgi:hypothetical protein